MTSVLSKHDLSTLDAYWRASNYLAAGQIYLKKNPLLSDPLAPEDIKPRLLGHWGTTPGLNFIYTHLNRLIRRHDLDMIYVIGPGHGGNAVIAQTYLEGSYSERHPEFTQDTTGMQELRHLANWACLPNGTSGPRLDLLSSAEELLRSLYLTQSVPERAGSGLLCDIILQAISVRVPLSLLVGSPRVIESFRQHSHLLRLSRDPTRHHLLIKRILIVWVLGQGQLCLLDGQIRLLCSDIEHGKQIVRRPIPWVDRRRSNSGGDRGAQVC